jgi:hypothetical protein
MHAATELAATSTRVIVVLGFLGVPFATRLSIQLPQAILLTLVVHDFPVGGLFASFLGRNLFTLEE